MAKNHGKYCKYERFTIRFTKELREHFKGLELNGKSPSQWVRVACDEKRNKENQ